jgi:ABC-2 type transport system permease protein
MAGLSAESRRQLSSIVWLRWRIFLNSFHGKGSRGDLIARFILYPILSLVWLAPASAAGFAAYLLVSRREANILTLPLLGVFVFWQFVGMNTSAAAPAFDLSSLTRFPIRYPDYLLVRLSFGLLDAPTLMGCTCLAAMAAGIGFAVPALTPWACLVLFLYATCNILFSRMIYIWLERWLAQRRTREMVAGLAILLSISLQVAGPLARQFVPGGHHSRPSATALRVEHGVVAVSRFLPPGLAAFSIGSAHRGQPIAAAANLGLLVLFNGLFLLILSARLHAQYCGESLSEAPASSSRGRQPKTLTVARPARSAHERLNRPNLPSFRATLAACLKKEALYLLRGRNMLYRLLNPLIVACILVSRSAMSRSAMQRDPVFGHGGFEHGAYGSLTFPYSCAYALLVVSGLLYNCFGTDGAGMQFYFLAPVRMREVVLAKNLVYTTVLAVEAALMYFAVCLIGKPPALGVVMATVSWLMFAFLLNITAGNLRSLYSPKKFEIGKVRQRNGTSLSGFIGLGVFALTVAVGAAVQAVCTRYADWGTAAAIFLMLAAAAAFAYIRVLNRLDTIAAERRLEFAEELCKA